MTQHDPKSTTADGARDAAKCDPECRTAPPGPVREGGGTTGDGNLTPQAANRTGGATGGVGTDADAPSRAGTIPPDA